MRITPLDIRHKEFTRSMRGYKDVEVDEFLDEITEEYERLFNENIDYQERLESREEKISQYRNIEDTLQKTLVSAQQQAEELKQNAQKEADLILRDTELKSRTIVNDAYAERQKIQRSVQALKQKHEDLRYQLRKIIETYANIIDQNADTFEEIELEGMDAPQATVKSIEGPSPTMEEAVSVELLAADRKEDRSESADAPSDQPRTDDRSIEDQVSAPPLKPAAGASEKEDPFADVEIDTHEDKFKW